MLKKTPLKRTQTTLKRSPIKRKSKTVEEKQQQKEDIEKMHKLFEEHWQLKMEVNGNRYCESCNCQLPREDKTLYHDHLLDKGIARYEHLKYELDNLFLCCWECHDLKGRGYPTEKHKQAIEEVKQKYGL